MESKTGMKLPTRKAGTEYLDAELVGSKVVLRHWRKGDRFQPIGMSTEVKLQDLFVNQKVPRAHRHKLVLAETEKGHIFWVEGLRISERFQLTKGTKRRLQWQWSRD
jgi:tRNA(Ile)-lysidine synthase